MNFTTLLKFGADITKDTPMGEKITFGLQVVGIGMGVVFGVLLILIGILQLFKLFAVKKPAEQKSNQSVPVAPTPVTAAPVSASASEEDTVVAVASAAIAAARGESECAFNIISIKKIVK